MKTVYDLSDESTISLPLRSQSQADFNAKDDLEYEDEAEETYQLPPRSQSEADFRISFLRRLSYERVWVPVARRKPKHQTVIIFDWDDTLLCTSFLTKVHQDRPLTPTIDRYLRLIESAARKLLELAIPRGQTFIITNAMDGWVESSAAKYLPQLLPVLDQVRVISARSQFEVHYPGDVSKWKTQAFLEVQRQMDSRTITNLISLGDSNFEMEAVHVMGKKFKEALVKTIKFRENPAPLELLKQLQTVARKFESLVENAKSLKTSLERKGGG